MARCTRCWSELGDRGSWFYDRREVCQMCWEELSADEFWAQLDRLPRNVSLRCVAIRAAVLAVCACITFGFWYLVFGVSGFGGVGLSG